MAYAPADTPERSTDPCSPAQNRRVTLLDWGEINYDQAWQAQKRLLESIAAVKLANRSATTPTPTPNYLILCRHPHVYTLGKSGQPEHLLLSAEELAQRGIDYYHIDRGGDITYHGPGQLVGYPILDLENFFTDIHRYLRTLEEAIIRSLAFFGVESGRFPGYTGVWLEGDTSRARKIAAMGVKCSRWITMHGFALNVQTDLQYFGHIVPCGINDKAVTSLHLEVQPAPELEAVQEVLLKELATCFECELFPGEEAEP